MGIKFFCPNGHKLNVKAYLSGKRAICPKCGAKVLVPTESQIGQRAALGTGAGPSYQNHGLPAEGSIPSAASPMAAPPLNPVAVAEYFGDRGMAGIDLGDVASAESQSIPRTDETLPVAQPPVPMSDLIDVVPSAIWYVRTPGGEQFGPLTEDTIRAWLKDGRVTADALVCRTGWQQWNTAGATFLFRPPGVPPPLHGAAPAQSLPSSGAAAPVVAPPVEDAPGTLIHRTRLRRRKQQHAALLISLALVVTTIILIFVLVLVLSKQKDVPKEPTNTFSFRPAAIETDLQIAVHSHIQDQT